MPFSNLRPPYLSDRLEKSAEMELKTRPNRNSDSESAFCLFEHEQRFRDLLLAFFFLRTSRREFPNLKLRKSGPCGEQVFCSLV